MMSAAAAGRNRHIQLFALAVTLAVSEGCVNASSILGPTGPHEIEGPVLDDSGLLPGGRRAGLAGARIEVLDGPKAGSVVLTDSAGTYRLPKDIGEGPITLRATKDGFDPHTEQFFPEYLAGPLFILGQAPHTLWGDVVLAGSAPSVLVPDIRLEILDGPNAGKVALGDHTGRYRFDDLNASPSYALRLSRTGHRTRTYTMPEFRHNQQHNVQIEGE